MIRFAIIGLGHIGRRHATHILSNEHTELVAVCDIDDTVREHIQGDNVKFYNDHQDLLAREDIDVVCVCTPNYLHCGHTVDVLNAGKHAVTEKPMALSVAECDAMIQASQQNGKTIFAVKQNRYNPPVQAVKKLITDGRLGSIYFIQVNCFWNRSNHYYAQSNWRGSKVKDGGCLFTQFSHFVDILYYLNGKVEKVQGSANNYAHTHNTEFEDTGSFVMQAVNGAMVNFNFTTCSYDRNMEGSITIIAEHGTVKIGGQYLNTIEYQCIKETLLPHINISAKENDYGLYKGSMSNHDKVIQNVVDVLRHNEPVMASAQQGRDVVELIGMMYVAVDV